MLINYSVLELYPSSEYVKSRTSLYFDIYEIFLFNKNGQLIAKNIDNKNFYNNENYKKIFSKLIKTTVLLDKKSNRQINHNIYFFNERKIMTVNITKSNIISVAVFSNRTKSKLIYFFLLEIAMSFLNYMKMHNCNTTYNIHSIIYESLLLNPIKGHFSLAIKEIFRRYTLYVNNIGYKNYYLVDLTSNEIILSLETLYDNNTNDEVETKIPNKVIWNEILFHSHNLKRDYIKKNNNIFQIDNLQDFYAKIEFKATYPRLTYIIKFMPLLGGMALIHEYTQTKMSRIDGDTHGYREFEYEYGYQFDQDGTFQTKSEEFLLNEPDVLIHIHFFIIECLLCNLDNLGFFIFNKYQKIYFNDEIIKIINKQLYSNMKISQENEICKNPKDVQNLLEKIANSLYEEYIQINAQEEESKESAMVHKKNEDDEVSLNRSFYIQYPDSLYITKKLTLKTIFESDILSQYINPNDISLDLSAEEESPIIDNIYQAIRDKNQFNKFNDPYFYYRYHYANSTKESRQLMDLLNDNVSINENEILLNLGKTRNKNIIFRDHNDLWSLNNNTELSSRQNLQTNFPFNPYRNNLAQINLNKNQQDNYYNASSSSSQIKNILKINGL